MSPQQTRISAKKSSSIPIGPKYTPAPVLQPKATKKPDRQLPEWQPEGGGMVSPLQRLLDTNAVQAKLTIGEPNDKYEQEADAVAQDVVQRLHSPVSETPPETAVQRETEAGKDKLQRKPILQRTHAVGGEPASPDLEGSINRAKGGGQPLDAGLQRSMSQAMGADFSGVRVHTDSHADQLNQSIQAKAFTTGQDVFFRQGAYDPGSRGGQELIAHELTHVVQQGGAASIPAKVQRNGLKQGTVKGASLAKGNELINDDPGLEREADLMGAKALQRKNVGGKTVLSRKLTTGIVQRRGRAEKLEKLHPKKPTLILKIVLPGSGDDQWRSQKKEDVAHKNEREFLGVNPVKASDQPITKEQKAAYDKGLWDPQRGEYNEGQYGIFTTPKPAYWKNIKANEEDFRQIVRTYPGPGGKGTQDSFTALGGVADAGSNRIEVNIKEVPKDVFSEVKDFVQDESKLDDYSVHILIKSHSRNAVAGCNIANVIAEKYRNNQSVNIELVAYDPVPGPNHWKTMYNDIVLSDRINESTVVYSIDSGYKAFFKPTTVRGAKRYIGTPRKHDAGMANGVLYKGKYYRGSELNELPTGAYAEIMLNDSQLAGVLMPVQSKKEITAALSYLTDQKLSSVSRTVGDEDYRQELIKEVMKEKLKSVRP